MKAEIRRYQREVLRPLGIKSRTRFGTSSNVFCGKRWVVVSKDDFQRAAEATVAWFENRDAYGSYRYVFEADLHKAARDEAAEALDRAMATTYRDETETCQRCGRKGTPPCKCGEPDQPEPRPDTAWGI